MFGLERLPEILPVFPLTGALLLPKGHLPLYIFESRYLDMIYHAREKHGMIGMIQPRSSPLTSPAQSDQFGTAPRGRPLYDIGCVGMISDMCENKDGGLNIMLTGLSRFKVAEEMPMSQTFREMRVDYDPYTQDCAAPVRSDDIDRRALVLKVEEYLKCQNIIPRWEALEKACDEELINALAMICPFDAASKQALLEVTTLADRLDLMMSLMAFSLSGKTHSTDNFIQ